MATAAPSLGEYVRTAHPAPHQADAHRTELFFVASVSKTLVHFNLKMIFPLESIVLLLGSSSGWTLFAAKDYIVLARLHIQTAWVLPNLDLLLL